MSLLKYSSNFINMNNNRTTTRTTTMSSITYNTRKVSDGTEVFYVEAGDASKPTLLLLHGFPSSSNQYRHLMPLLSKDFHLIAPDLPGFGQTIVPEGYTYTFDTLAHSIDLLIESIGLKSYSAYIFDYGGPVLFRLALAHPERLTGLIVQNSNAYEEGLSDAFWKPLKQFWKSDRENPELVKALEEYLQTDSNFAYMYENGMGQPEQYDKTNFLLDMAKLREPGQTKIQLDLFHDYQSNVKLYPKVQELFRKIDVPVLVAWGKNDYCFSTEGAEAYSRDNKRIVYHYVDSGHFALEDHVGEIADAIVSKFKPLLKSKKYFFF